MLWRWFYFGMGTCGWVVFVVMIWHGMGWIFGVCVAVTAFVSILEWLEGVLLKQWNMNKIVTYEENE